MFVAVLPKRVAGLLHHRLYMRMVGAPLAAHLQLVYSMVAGSLDMGGY